MDKIKAFFRWLADKWYAFVAKIYGAPPAPPDPPATVVEMAAAMDEAAAKNDTQKAA